ncbi:hypothetical protein A9Q91_02035 [Candidatus Gracilibacteria bacterium 28_42_T64]|nr:hypothetical protein A9Q91_02035 [Candidatus Gracilibacteria bacterium 28_42_T64]
MSDKHSESPKNNDNSQNLEFTSEGTHGILTQSRKTTVIEDVRSILSEQKTITPVRDNVDNTYEEYRRIQELQSINELIDCYKNELLDAPIHHRNSTLKKHIEITEKILKQRLGEMLGKGVDLTVVEMDLYQTLQ